MSSAKSNNPFQNFHSSPEVIRLVVMIYIRFPLSLRNVEDLSFERWIGSGQVVQDRGAAHPRMGSGSPNDE